MYSSALKFVINSTKNLSLVKVSLFVIFILLSVLVSMKRKHVQRFIIANVYSDTILDIMDDVEPPPESIFFIETTHLLGLDKVTEVEMNYRKACTVESTAKAHPYTMIYILYTTPIKHPTQAMLEDPKYAALKQIYKLRNVHIRSMNVTRFMEHTPLETFFTSSGKFATSSFPNVHLSDMLRLVVLWKYGGTYLDMDQVVTKSFYDLGKNYIGIESDESTNKLANGVINLDNKGIGREITDACLKEIFDNFVGTEWAANGPYLVTRIINKVCNTKNISALQGDDCKGFHAVPYWIFYPYHWGQWVFPFEHDRLKQGLEDMKRSYALHLFSHSSDVVPVLKNASDVLYGVVAKQYCPDSFENSGEVF